MKNNRIYTRMTKVANEMTTLEKIKAGVNTEKLVQEVLELAEWFYDRNVDSYGTDRTLEEFCGYLPKEVEDVFDIIFNHLPESITDEQIDELGNNANELNEIGEYLIDISYNAIERLYNELDDNNDGDSNPGDVRDSDFI